MSKRIELRSITKLNDCLLRSEYLYPDIKDNDKTPSWDGFIELYHDKDKYMKKTNYSARIPVQVKGETNTDIFSDHIQRNVKRADLKIYLKTGVIYFIVRMSDYDNYRIYYETLTPFKIQRYLKSMKNRGSISITFRTFPKDNIEEFTDIFFVFSHDMGKQPSDKIFSLDDLKKTNTDRFDQINMHYNGIRHKQPMDYFLENEATVYVTHTKTGISFPVDIIKINEFSQYLNSPVLIEDTEYYPNVKMIRSTDGTKVLVGNSVSFMYYKHKEKVDFNIKIQGTLSERIKDTEFILALLKNKYYKVGGDQPHTFDFKTVSREFDGQIEYYTSYLNYYTEIKKVLDILKVNDELDLDNNTDKDYENINMLISSILHNNSLDLVVHDTEKTGSFNSNVKVCNLIIAILFIKGEDGKYTLTNFFNDRYSATYQVPGKDKPIFVSMYLSLTEDAFLKLSNIDYEKMYNSFAKLEINEDLLNMTNFFILNMISAYDKSKKQILLETSLKIMDWIITNDRFTNQEVYLLNKMQIIKRMRKLSDLEISQLLNIISNSKENKNLTGAHLLLENSVMVDYHFNKLSESEQADFKKYPICIFWNK